MKNVFILLVLTLFWSSTNSQGLSINDSGTNPDTSAMLDVASSSKGVLIPRLTTSGRNSISLPALGLVIYNTDENCFNYFNGSTWLNLCGNTSNSSVPIVHVYTSNEIWTKPQNLKYITVELVGGGGGGAGVVEYGGGSGAGAGYARKIISSGVLGPTEIILIGSGGIGGSPGVSGGNGGTTLFGSHCSATGGNGGLTHTEDSVNTTGSFPGIGVGGDLNISGQGTGGSVGTGKPLYCGGSSYFGGGAPANPSNSSANGINANNYGSGGSGGIGTTGFDKNGGNGSSGVVIVTEYF